MTLATRFVQDGDIIDYANTGSAISYLEIIPISGRIYIAAEDIAATTGTGGIYTEGVFEFPAVNDTAFSIGDPIYWDTVAGKATKVVKTTFCGDCVKAKAQTGTTAYVKIRHELDTDILESVTEGTVTASKIVLVDSNKDIGDFRNLDAVNIDAGSSGVAGTVDIFPTTASKGKLELACTDQTGNTTVTVNANAMGQATTINITDPGGATSYFMQSNAACVGVTATATELNRTCDVSNRLVNAGGTLSATEALHDGKIVCLDTAAGSVVTLPNATGSGAKFTFAVTTTATSNSHIIKTARIADHMAGLINVFDQDGTAAGMYQGDGTADDTITMNRTTTGGIIGDLVEAIDIKANVWLIRGAITCVAGSNIADPFSATVS